MAELYIGIMSGTSMDGVDVALCEISPSQCKLVAFLEYTFPQKLKEEIIQMINGTTSLYKVGEINHRLGLLFSEAVNSLLERDEMEADSITAIGLHGQTLWHNPHGEYPFSMQLGDASLIAAETHINVVSDFRSKDLALGGEGAPFAPVFHQFLFDYLTKAVGVLNIGGVANLSILQERLIGFDTGPGNVLMDLWVEKHKHLPYDKEGEWAKEGEVDQPLLEEMLSESYFATSAPKSTGRELFNEKWLMTLVQKHPTVTPQDVQATLLALTVESIAREVKKYKVEHLLVCGGGVKNSFLMNRLAQVLEEIGVFPTDAYGVNSEQMEAMLFAWLAYKRLHEEPVELKTVTGAKRNGILGGLYARD
ncbi:MAG: anhydro-N-acetylmuramic acid kinase [Helicobacteraceae bacterium]|jgi:anhydro-N-acetylmuramic acid kinase|nr:anhydro-N-acetylmuramic acid kinase [Helicobacteraceae bacterium]